VGGLYCPGGDQVAAQAAYLGEELLLDDQVTGQPVESVYEDPGDWEATNDTKHTYRHGLKNASDLVDPLS